MTGPGHGALETLVWRFMLAVVVAGTSALALLGGAAQAAAAGNGDVSFSPSTTRAGEGDGSVTLTVHRSGVGLAAGSVTWRTRDGTARAGSDYVAQSGTLVFAVGETAKQVRVPILDDHVPESDETFDVVLSSADSGGAVATVGPPATVTIADDDTADSSVSAASSSGTGVTASTPSGGADGGPGVSSRIVTLPRTRVNVGATSRQGTAIEAPPTALHIESSGAAPAPDETLGDLPAAELPLALIASLLLAGVAAQTWFVVRMAELDRARRNGDLV